MTDRAVAVLLAVSLIANIGMGVFIIREQSYCPDNPMEQQDIKPNTATTLSSRPPVSAQERRTASLQGPAVLTSVNYVRRGQNLYLDTTRIGTTMNIMVEVLPGEGRVLVQTTPLMGIVFQEAANTAVAVSRNRTNTDMSHYDVIFSIESSGQIPAVDGPSAGALMTLITGSAITGRPLWQNGTLTGSINPDGSIGPIGGVIEKATAAKAAGKDLLLLPSANARLTVPREETRNFGGLQMLIRQSEIVSAKEYIERTTGIRVEYVDGIDDVERYLIKTA